MSLIIPVSDELTQPIFLPSTFIVGTEVDDSLEGTEHDDLIFGEGGDDRLMGLGGNDLLDGGTGINVLIGGLGDDYYQIYSLEDVIIEALDEGTDTVSSTVDGYVLGDNLENLVMLDVDGTLGAIAYGNSLSNVISVNNGQGYSDNDLLCGAAGDDTLLGGTGSDTLRGGAGNDRLDGTANPVDYIRSLSSGFDVLIGGEGADTFVLGGEQNYSFDASGLLDEFALIVEFDALSGDRIAITDALDLYRLDASQDRVGSSDLDTAIYKGNDLIAVIQDRVAMAIAEDLVLFSTATGLG